MLSVRESPVTHGIIGIPALAVEVETCPTENGTGDSIS
jgi:hypothetical protein